MTTKSTAKTKTASKTRTRRSKQGSAKSINKSKAIRDYDLKTGGTKTPAQIAATLGRRGIKVSTQFVSTIRSTAKSKHGKVAKPGRPKRVAVVRQRGGDDQYSVATLVTVKQLLREVGGADALYAAAKAVEELTTTP